MLDNEIEARPAEREIVRDIFARLRDAAGAYTGATRAARAGRERAYGGRERAVVPGHSCVADVQSDERAHSRDQRREERSEQERRREERRVVDGELDDVE